MSKCVVVQGNRPGAVRVTVADTETGGPAAENASISLYHYPKDAPADHTAFDARQYGWTRRHSPCKYRTRTDKKGVAQFDDVAPGCYIVSYDHYPETEPVPIEVQAGCSVAVAIALQLSPAVAFDQPCAPPGKPSCFAEGERVDAAIIFNDYQHLLDHARVRVVPPWVPVEGEPLRFTLPAPRAGRHELNASLLLDELEDARGAGGAGLAGPGGAVAAAAAPPAAMFFGNAFNATGRPVSPISGNLTVSMSRTETEPTEDLALWTLIRNSTDALSFTNYLHFIDGVFCNDKALASGPPFEQARFALKNARFQTLRGRRFLPFVDADAYRVLKAATEAFVMVNCGVINDAFDPEGDNSYLDRRDIPSGLNLARMFDKYLETEDGIPMLPYLAVLRRKLPDIMVVDRNPDEDLCFGIIQKKLSNPCMIELIWSYWQEEGMLVQSMNAITRRFQNVRGGTADPLSNLEIDPLRPLNNLIWGYTQDEQHRLTVVRRNYEYDHHYGVRLAGRAIREFRPADSRSKFLEAFHFLLRLCSAFFRQDDDTTVKADAFPVLNALKEVHLILSQGAHNQFGDLPSTARIEMMMQQWLLGRPEFREFLPTRIMVAYPEPWMDRVDAMKKLQEWTDTSVMHFRSLAIFGEQLLLSIRYGNWSDIFEPTPAFNWTRFWRPQIQGYIHAYRAATGVDLAGEQRDPVAEGTLPSVLLRRRLDQQARTTA
jgi:hypothetical protein